MNQELKEFVAKMRTQAKQRGIQMSQSPAKSLGQHQTPPGGLAQMSGSGGNQRGRILAKNSRSLTR
jgi:hypothetical protein